MSKALSVSIGGATDKGVKAINQDFLGSVTPKEPQLSAKGIALAMADGISSSKVSQIASETAVASFLDDYYCTSDSWSVKSSVQKVIKSINSWLYSQTRNSPYRFDKDKGYICTFSALVFKSNTAHLFHSGDTRIYRLSGDGLEQLTEDHRRVVSSEVTYLTRALGIDQTLEIDYQSLTIEPGDTFVIATDGIYEFIKSSDITKAINNAESLNDAAQLILEQALEHGSDDNLSCAIVEIKSLPQQSLDDYNSELTRLPFPPELEPGMSMDGYLIKKEMFASSRSQLYLVEDQDTGETLVMKTPSANFIDDTGYIDRFIQEEWIGKRIDSPNVVKIIHQKRPRKFLYYLMELVQGQSLDNWMKTNRHPKPQQAIKIVEQIAQGLKAFHQKETIHQGILHEQLLE